MGIKPMTLWSYCSVLTNWAINPIQSKSTVSMFFVVFCQLFKLLNSEGVFSQNESSTVHSLVGVRVRWLRAKHFCVWPNQTLSWRILSHNEFKTVYLSNCPARAGKYSLYSRAIWPFSAPLKKMRMAYMPSLLAQGFCRYFVWRVHTWLYGSFDE